MIEKHTSYQKSIWGQWWVPVRKWFYPAWLVYETSVRFYEYTKAVHLYFQERHGHLSSYVGPIGARSLDLFCSAITFVGCTAFLTVPASFILYQFFKTDNLTRTSLEGKFKKVF